MSPTPGTLTEVLALPESAERVRASRADVVEHLDAGYRALFVDENVLPASTLHALAAIVARWQGSAILTEHHEALADAELIGERLPHSTKLRAIVEHVDLITVSPALVARDDQLTLQLAGVTSDEIVLISQVVASTSTAVRVAHAFTLISGETPRTVAPFSRRTVAHGRDDAAPSHTARGSVIPTEFTRDVLSWEPWVPAPSEDDLTEAQRDSFAAKASTNSEYFRLLSRVPAVLKARSALDNAVFQGRGGLPRGERELAATVTSKINDCVYCASVHSRKAAFQTKRTEDIDRLLSITLERDADWVATNAEALAEGQDERWGALIRFTAKLSELVPTADVSDVKHLVAEGLRLEEVADAALATAFFSWANRLMLSLGEPAVPVRPLD